MMDELQHLPHEANKEEHPVNKNTRSNPTIKGTNGKMETQSNQVFTTIFDPQKRIATDHTVPFPVKYNRGGG